MEDHRSQNHLSDLGIIHALHSLQRSKNTSILIPPQERILPILCLRLFHIRPPPQELLMREDTREFAGNSSVHHFHNVEVGGEEDVEVALMYLFFTQNMLIIMERGLTRGVRTGTVRLWYLVCTIGALTPLIVSGPNS
jgi:hypothetical protein